LTLREGALLSCLIMHLLRDGPEMPGEELTEEPSEVWSLSWAESVPQGWARLGRA
jgi:hypothetical protein